MLYPINALTNQLTMREQSAFNQCWYSRESNDSFKDLSFLLSSKNICKIAQYVMN